MISEEEQITSRLQAYFLNKRDYIVIYLEVELSMKNET